MQSVRARKQIPAYRRITAAASTKSSGDVILILDELDGTSRTLSQINSTDELSSVILIFFFTTISKALRSRATLNAWGVCTRHSLVRSMVWEMIMPLSTSLTVSVILTAATPEPYWRADLMVSEIKSSVTQGRAPSCTATTSASSLISAKPLATDCWR